MPQLNASNPIVFEDGSMQVPFRDQMTKLNDNLPLVGAGSPEGVVNAPQYSLYIDSAGTTGALQYRKMQTDIGGDTKQGWILV